MELSVLKDRSMIIFHMFEKFVLCPSHKMPAVPSGAPCLSLRAACGRRTRFSQTTSFPRIGAEARTTGRPHPSFPMNHRHPTLPRVCRCQEKVAERQKSVVGAPAITQKTQRCGRAAVFYPASGKKCGKHISGNGRRPFPVHHPYRRKNSVHAGTACRYSGSFQSLPIS